MLPLQLLSILLSIVISQLSNPVLESRHIKQYPRMESTEETPTQPQETQAIQATQAQAAESPTQTITRVTKKRIKDPVKQQAGRLGAAIRTHNLKKNTS